LGGEPVEVLSARDLMAVFESEEEVLALRPDFDELGKLDAFAVLVTAPGREVDFVSRFFAPKAGIQEDPVTGSAHCTLTPFWAERLGKRVLRARQVSGRGGELFCEERGERVIISGRAIEYLRGEINV
jgi:predicted PhzF superfamily epimerase YddE/YHI9